MTEQLRLDDRIYNPYAVEDLEQSHPAIFAVLKRWFEVICDFEDEPILRVIRAHSAADAAKDREACQRSLIGLPAVLSLLDELITTLDAGLAAERPGSEGQGRLSLLAEAARHNRREFGRMPELVAKVLSQSESAPADALAGEQAVENTAKKLEALAAASEGQRSFAALHPLLAQLRAAWAELDGALRNLPSLEQKRLRAVQRGRTQAAVGRLSANLLAAKARAHAAGELAAQLVGMHEQTVTDEFVVALLRADYAGACALLAPWLAARWTPDTLRQAVEREYALTAAVVAEQAGAPVVLLPADYSIASNPLGLAELRGIQSGTWGEVPVEIIAENFGGWKPFKLLTDEDDAYLTDIEYLLTGYLIPVRTADGERIGLLSIG